MLKTFIGGICMDTDRTIINRRPDYNIEPDRGYNYIPYDPYGNVLPIGPDDVKVQQGLWVPANEPTCNGGV
jgi:hypothetical protein